MFSDEIPFRRGIRIRTDSPFVPPQVKAALFFRRYERAEVDLSRYLPVDAPVVELGASIGVLALTVMSRLDPGVAYVCLEANPRLLPLLRLNLQSEVVRGRPVEIVHAALASGPGHLKLAIGERNVDGRLLEDEGPNAVGEVESVEVPAVELSEVVGKVGAGFTLISDIEGAEVEFILKPNSLKDCRALLIELHEVRRDGVEYTLDDLRHRLIVGHGMAERAKYGAVSVFTRDLV